MSRRSKLLLLAVLLAGASLVAVQLFLTWSPEDPLRFRLSAAGAASAEGPPMIDYPVTVENTTSTTIHLMKADLFAPVKGGDDSLEAYAYVSSALIPYSAAASAPLTVIPPHSTCELVLPLHKNLSLENLKDAHINYFCTSRTKAAAFRAVVQLGKSLPFLKLDPLFPYLDTDIHGTAIEFQ